MKYKKIIIIIKFMAFSAIVYIVGFGFVIGRRFNPPNHLNFSSRNGNNRLLAVAPDSADGTVLLMACDWPHTFFAPFVLGDAAWPEKYSSANCRWSRDMSLIVWEVQEVDEKTKRYEAAYDFRNHSGFDLQKYAWNKGFCDRAISVIISERGGLDSSPIDIPALNSGLYQ